MKTSSPCEAQTHGSTSAAGAHLEAYHDRVRDIALAGMSEQRRCELHLKIATALETSGLAEPETLARHYRHARDRDCALVWTRRAAKHAASTLAFGRAVELCIDAVALATDPMQRLERRFQIGGVVVLEVLPGTPAEKSGLRGLTQSEAGVTLGDVIVKVGELRVKSYDDLYNALDGKKAGEKVKVRIVRGTDGLDLMLELTLVQ